MQVNIRAKPMAPPPPHLNIAQRIYFMANKVMQETTVKSRKQIVKFFIFRIKNSGAGLQFGAMAFKQVGNIHISVGDSNMKWSPTI